MVLGAHFEIQGLSQGFSDLGCRVPGSPGKSRGFALQQAGPRLMLTPRRVGEACAQQCPLWSCGRRATQPHHDLLTLDLAGSGGWVAGAPCRCFRICTAGVLGPVLRSALSDTPPPAEGRPGALGPEPGGQEPQIPLLPVSGRRLPPSAPSFFACGPVMHLRARWMRGLGVCVKLAGRPHRWWSVRVAEELS